MTYLSSWEEFEKGAERLYLQDPINVCVFIQSHVLYSSYRIVSDIVYILLGDKIMMLQLHHLRLFLQFEINIR